MTVRIGILGVGEIAEAIVDGLSATARSPLIRVSPRGASTAYTLATKYPDVAVCPDNQTVVDRPCGAAADPGRHRPRDRRRPVGHHRLLHHATVVITEGDTYRMKNARHRKENPSQPWNYRTGRIPSSRHHRVFLLGH